MRRRGVIRRFGGLCLLLWLSGCVTTPARSTCPTGSAASNVPAESPVSAKSSVRGRSWIVARTSRAAAPGKRLETIRALSDAGIPVSVMTAPMIPALNDVEMEAILEAAAEAGAVGAGYTLHAWAQVLGDPYYLEIFWRTAWVAGLTTVLCVLIGAPEAYILSRMQSQGASFADALREAQQAGYAEADPTEDVDGADAAAKLAIISAVGLRRPVKVTEIATRSIRPIEAVDFEYARALGCTIRQIARAEIEKDGSVFAAVRPALVPLTSRFAQIEGSQNIVSVRGVYGGETTFSGSGAGGGADITGHKVGRPAAPDRLSTIQDRSRRKAMEH